MTFANQSRATEALETVAIRAIVDGILRPGKNALAALNALEELLLHVADFDEMLLLLAENRLLVGGVVALPADHDFDVALHNLQEFLFDVLLLLVPLEDLVQRHLTVQIGVGRFHVHDVREAGGIDFETLGRAVRVRVRVSTFQ